MKKNTGYTLIELMTILAVAAILLTIGVPQLKVFFQSNRMVSNTNDLVTALNLARAEAIRRGSRATACKSKSGAACDGTSWADGWIVFAKDPNALPATACTFGPTDVLVRVHPAVDGSDVSITPQAASLNSCVSFTSRGVPKDSGGNSQAGVFSVCDARGLTVASGVEVNAAGNVRTTHDAAKIVSCP
jgi:type IV fimbrial biogenesis protein FimT